jgi:uncharacterized protein (DUF433 family)/predicted DNA-binding transcriptional regulator AlpA
MDGTDPRATAPILTPQEVSALVGMPVSTVYSWMHPTRTRPALIHNIEPEVRGWPRIPLVGLAEASVLRAMREQGVRMSEIGAAVLYLRERGGEFALGNPHLVTDGVSALLTSDHGLETLLSGQGVLVETVLEHLHPFTLAPDGFVRAYVVPRLEGVEIDPRFASGRMRFTRTGVPLFAVAGLLSAGDPAEVVADEFELSRGEVELVREHLPWLSTVA